MPKDLTCQSARIFNMNFLKIILIDKTYGTQVKKL